MLKKKESREKTSLFFSCLSTLNKKAHCQKIILFFISILLWTMAFPGLLIKDGAGFFGWVALIPIFLLLFKTSQKTSALWGFLFGLFSYFSSQFWLLLFNPVAMWFVAITQGLYFSLLFFLMKIVIQRRSFAFCWLLALLWVSYEYLKSQGFLAYPFGVLGYSQYKSFWFVQGAAFGGVWILSFLMVLPQVFLADLFSSFSSEWKNNVRNKLKGTMIHFSIFFVLLFLVVGLGLISVPSENSIHIVHGTEAKNKDSIRISLVQSNNGIVPEPLLNGKRDRRDMNYRKASNYNSDLIQNISLSYDAAAAKPDCIIWSETAFIPGIYWYLNGGHGSAKLAVDNFIEFNKSIGIPILTGNSDGRPKDPNSIYTFSNRIDYNSAILVDNGKILQTYSKQKLVPFTEKYPFGRFFPGLKKFMQTKWGSSFFEPGKKNSYFKIHNYQFATPICYEDGFGNLIREMTEEGSDFFINITNDSWSGSYVAQQQHLAMSVLRAIEVRRPVLRAAQSGQTCAIEPSGKIAGELKPFVPQVLTVDMLKTTTPTSIYQIIGDIFAKIACTLSLLWIILILAIKYNKSRGR